MFFAISHVCFFALPFLSILSTVLDKKHTILSSTKHLLDKKRTFATLRNRL